MAVFVADRNRVVSAFDTVVEAARGEGPIEREFYGAPAPGRFSKPAPAPAKPAEAPAGTMPELPLETAPEAEGLPGLAQHLAGHIRAVLGHLRDASARLDDLRRQAEAERAEATETEARIAEVTARHKRLDADARARLKDAKSNLEAARIRREIAELDLQALEELEGLQPARGTPGPAERRLRAAEREAGALMSQLREATEQGASCARVVAGRIAELETADPAELAEPGAPTRARKRPASKGRNPGETRGRRSGREGKRFWFRPDVQGNPASKGSRRWNSYRIIFERPGITYESYLQYGGDPADLGLALARGQIVMRD